MGNLKIQTLNGMSVDVVDTVLEHTSFARKIPPQGLEKSKTQQMSGSWSFIPDVQPNEVGP